MLNKIISLLNKIFFSTQLIFIKPHIKLIDKYLVFQNKVCSAQNVVPQYKYFFTFIIAITISELWWILICYFYLMIFAIISVAFGKLYPRAIGLPLCRFYKKYSSDNIFIKYCGNEFESISGSGKDVLTRGIKNNRFDCCYYSFRDSCYW